MVAALLGISMHLSSARSSPTCGTHSAMCRAGLGELKGNENSDDKGRVYVDSSELGEELDMSCHRGQGYRGCGGSLGETGVPLPGGREDYPDEATCGLNVTGKSSSILEGRGAIRLGEQPGPRFSSLTTHWGHLGAF